MRIRRIALKNWMNFASAEAAVQDRVFLVGPNASGKSNFLDAFRFLRDLASTGGGFREAVRLRDGVPAIRCLAARRDSDVAIAVTLEDGGDAWTYELSFNQDRQRPPSIRSERVRRNDELLVDRPTERDEGDPERLTQTHLEQVNVNQPFRELAGFFASIRYLHIVPQLIREPDRSVGHTNDPFGGDFLELVARTPAATQKARLRRIQQALRVAVPQLDEIKIDKDARGTPHLRGKYLHWRRRGAWQSEKQFSDGTLRLLGLLWAALEKGGPAAARGTGAVPAPRNRARPAPDVRARPVADGSTDLRQHALARSATRRGDRSGRSAAPTPHAGGHGGVARQRTPRDRRSPRGWAAARGRVGAAHTTRQDGAVGAVRRDLRCLRSFPLRWRVTRTKPSRSD